MTKKQEYVVRACSHLGLAASLNVKIETPDGHRARANVVVSQTSVDFKVYIFDSDAPPSKEIRDFIQSTGDTCSTFGNPPDSESFDLQSYFEMFDEWGFSPRQITAFSGLSRWKIRE